MVKFLLEKGSNINAKDRLNRDAYDLAVKNARHDVIKLLEICKKTKIINNVKINFGWLLNFPKFYLILFNYINIYYDKYYLINTYLFIIFYYNLVFKDIYYFFIYLNNN